MKLQRLIGVTLTYHGIWAIAGNIWARRSIWAAGGALRALGEVLVVHPGRLDKFKLPDNVPNDGNEMEAAFLPIIVLMIIASLISRSWWGGNRRSGGGRRGGPRGW